MDANHADHSFCVMANILCAKMAMLLGWRPYEFWDATPAEIACILNAAPQQDTPVDRQVLSDLIAKDAQKITS